MHKFYLISLVGLFLFSCTKEVEKENPLVSDGNNKNIITEEVAKSVALNFVTGVNSNSKNETTFSKKGSFRVEEFSGKDIDEVIVISDQKNVPSLYVVTFKPVGYVIISATTKESPVLGFSTSSVFSLKSNLPEGFANWILGRLDLIQRLKYSEDIEVPSSIQDEWSAYMPREEDQISVYAGQEVTEKSPLLKTKWGQNSNKFLTDISCDGIMKKPPTGCVATAMAQIMKYHKFPKDRYDWDSMSNTDFWGSNDEISKLMRDVGTPLNMSYGCKSSGTYTNNMIGALVSFGYSDNMIMKEYKLSTLISELDNNRPVVMSGYKNVSHNNYFFFDIPHYKDGHAWVCDGYRENVEKYINNPGTRYEYEKQITTIFLHMNWGWNGQNDGWYVAYSPYNLSGIGGNEFSYKLEMIVNIKP